VVLKQSAAQTWVHLGQFSPTAEFAASRLAHPQTGKFSVMTVLVEDAGTDPVLFVDLNEDGTITPAEKAVLKLEKKDNPYLWIGTAPLAAKGDFFTQAPIFIRYFKSVKVEKMDKGDRLVTQSTEVMARGTVDVKGRPVVVQ